VNASGPASKPLSVSGHGEPEKRTSRPAGASPPRGRRRRAQCLARRTARAGVPGAPCTQIHAPGKWLAITKRKPTTSKEIIAS